MVDIKINPLDLQPRKAVGINLPFTGEAVFTQSYQTKDATKTNLISHFLTSKGERYLNPEVGSSIGRYLFEQMTPTQLRIIEDTIREELKAFFPKIQVEKLEVDSRPENNMIQFFLGYSIKNTEEVGEIILNFIT